MAGPIKKISEIIFLKNSTGFDQSNITFQLIWASYK